MAQEGSPHASMTTNSSTSNYWELHAHSHQPSWNSWHPQNPNPNSNSSSCDDDISLSTSFTNASNHTGLNTEHGSSTLADINMVPTKENHLWNQVLLDDGEKYFLEMLSSKSLSSNVFEPACNYLKKLDNNNWEFAQSSSLQSLDKHLNGSFAEQERLTTNLSDLVTNCSIAPQEPQTLSVNSPMFPYLEEANLPNISLESESSAYMPCYRHENKEENQQQLMRSFGYPSGTSDVPWSPSMRSFSDMMISFNGCLNKPCSSKGLAFPDMVKKQGPHAAASSSTSTRRNVSGTGLASEGKKKRSEDDSENIFKRSKHENSAVSSSKTQALKVKLGGRITVLQQIVSPFGKTDTASVLFEAVNYIKFLHEQIHLFSNPFMRAGANKDHINTWVGLERKDRTESKKLDLKSRGLCLVPISCTPEICHDNSGPDYWTPTHRGCLYR
ncbi:hypothetical protein QJS10_CPB15g00144 [Acorus calamus]|uniref:BHLH domain-containing protein n=1 Tax=Acorus calamus TaxID=4465 RepID=A0AAV9D8R7_ACOCL|nr:hypothetical protein QJS10_CPB15g00144 [Acorus calamus]